jgi:hypothetical protein
MDKEIVGGTMDRLPTRQGSEGTFESAGSLVAAEGVAMTAVQLR